MFIILKNDKDSTRSFIIFVIILNTTIDFLTETLADLKRENIYRSHDAQSDNCILEGNRNHKVFFIFSNNFS